MVTNQLRLFRCKTLPAHFSSNLPADGLLKSPTEQLKIIGKKRSCPKLHVTLAAQYISINRETIRKFVGAPLS